MNDFAHPEFPAFRHQPSPMKAQRQALSQLPMAELQLTLRNWICPQLLRTANACKVPFATVPYYVLSPTFTCNKSLPNSASSVKI
jgi:hypothetical protein